MWSGSCWSFQNLMSWPKYGSTPPDSSAGQHTGLVTTGSRVQTPVQSGGGVELSTALGRPIGKVILQATGARTDDRCPQSAARTPVQG